jgi:hypothetical protein
LTFDKGSGFPALKQQQDNLSNATFEQIGHFSQTEVQGLDVRV